MNAYQKRQNFLKTLKTLLQVIVPKKEAFDYFSLNPFLYRTEMESRTPGNPLCILHH